MESCVSINSISLEEVAGNVDLLTLILLRVPAKSLIRFKCVSKHWLSLISDSKFSNNHTRKSLKHSVSGLYIDSYPIINFNTKSVYPRSNLPKLDFLTTSSGMKATILHSCNGLTLCSRGTEIIVCNLTTQKFKVLPSFSSGSRFKVLSSDGINSPHYKVVSIGVIIFETTESYKYCYYISIYSLETDMWKELNNFIGPKFEPQTSMVLCDGAIYWINEKKNLLRFNIDEEKFETIQIPIEPILFLDNYTFSYFGESDGHLFLIQTRMPNEPKYQIFEMDMNNFRWTLKYDLNVKASIDTVYENMTTGDASYKKHVRLCMERDHKQCNQRCVYALFFKGGDEVETHSLLLAYGRKIISYYPSNNCWEILPDLPDEVYEAMDRRAHKFIESMAPV